MLYGYASRRINEYGLLELREITFAVPSATLRQIARFLDDMAGEADAGRFDRISHIHIASVDSRWNAPFDVIVSPPSDAEAAPSGREEAAGSS